MTKKADRISRCLLRFYYFKAISLIKSLINKIRLGFYLKKFTIRGRRGVNFPDY